MSRIRDAKRIKKFCDELAEIWATNVPNWRFGQFMSNVLGNMQRNGRDPFSQEDEELMEYFRAYFKEEEN